MAEEKLIQVNLQLPASELAGLTTLVQQLQSLLAIGSPAAAREREENTVFDETRFQALADAARAVKEVGENFSSEAPAVEPKFSNVPAAESGMAPDFPDASQAPAADGTRWTVIAASAFTAAVEGVLSTPSSAGFPVLADSQLPQARHGSSGMEQLMAESPAPLTAEAVSLAFRRDDRRYDNGFPLY